MEIYTNILRNLRNLSTRIYFYVYIYTLTLEEFIHNILFLHVYTNFNFSFKDIRNFT